MSDQFDALKYSVQAELKRKEAAELIISTAKQISNTAKQFPKTGKKRNIFIKSYKRRPQNKKKRSLAMVNIAITSALSAMQLNMIASKPIHVPKFPPGTIKRLNAPAIVGGIDSNGKSWQFYMMPQPETLTHLLPNYLEERRKIEREIANISFDEPMKELKEISFKIKEAILFKPDFRMPYQ